MIERLNRNNGRKRRRRRVKVVMKKSTDKPAPMLRNL